MRVTWRIHMCDMTHSYVWSFTPAKFSQLTYGTVTWYLCLWHDAFIRDMTHYTCAMTHSYVWHDSFICVPWLIHMYDMTWVLDTCNTTHSYVPSLSCLLISRMSLMSLNTHMSLSLSWLTPLAYFSHLSHVMSHINELCKRVTSHVTDSQVHTNHTHSLLFYHTTPLLNVSESRHV